MRIDISIPDNVPTVTCRCGQKFYGDSVTEAINRLIHHLPHCNDWLAEL